MPIQSNIAVQMTGTVMWDGAAVGTPIDIRTHNEFGFTFEVTADITTDAVFTAEAADADPADNTAPGAFANVTEILTCESDAAAGDATFVIPAGTVAGTLLGGTIANRAGAFIRLAATSGDTANVKAVAMRKGPNMLAG